MNLSSVIDRVIEQTPSLKSVASRKMEIQGELAEVKSARWPSLSILSMYTRGDNPVYVFGSLLEQQSFGIQNFAIDSLNNPDYHTNIKNALVLGVPIFTGFKIQNNQKMGKLGLENIDQQLEKTSQQTRLQSIDAFVTVLLKKNTIDVLSERITSAQDELESARRLNQKGLVLGSDYYMAQSILGGLKAQKLLEEKNLESALNRLLILMNEESPTLNLSGTLSKASYSVPSQADLMKQALNNRREVKQAELQVSMANVAVRQAGYNFLPQIEAFASLETNTEDFSSNPTNRMVGVKSQFPIGDPSYFAKKSKANAQAQVASHEKENLEELIRMEVSQSLKQLEAALSTRSILEDVLGHAKKSLELFRPLYREGRQSIMEVLRAEEGVARAQIALLDNIYGIHMAYAKLQLTTGSLNSEAIQIIQTNLETQP